LLLCGAHHHLLPFSLVEEHDDEPIACRLLITTQKKSLIETQKKSKDDKLVHRHFLQAYQKKQ
jgi:hypothetical protein